MVGYSEATDATCICEDCVEEVCEETKCEYCADAAATMFEGCQSCRKCKVVSKDGTWHKCPAPDCPVQERLQDNCCKSCWNTFLEGLGVTAGVVKITSATKRFVNVQQEVFYTDFLRTIRQEMAMRLRLPPTSLAFMNPHGCILSDNDIVASIESKKQCAQSVTPPRASKAQEVLMIEWVPEQPCKFNRETGEHGYGTLECGHESCALADARDGCQQCKEEAVKAEKKRLAKEKAKQAIETRNVSSDLEALLRIKFKSNRVRDFISGLAAEAKNASNSTPARKQKKTETLKPVKKQKTSK